MAKKTGDSPDKAEVKGYYEDKGWKATISKYRIAPKDLSVLLGMSKAKKKAKPKAKPEKKRGPGRPRKDAAAAPKKAPRKTKKAVAKNPAPKKKGKGGRKANPQLLIDRTIENLEKLRGLLAAA